MQLRYGGIFSNHYITTFPGNVPAVEKIENRSIFGEDMEKKFAAYFSYHLVVWHGCKLQLQLHATLEDEASRGLSKNWEAVICMA